MFKYYPNFEEKSNLHSFPTILWHMRLTICKSLQQVQKQCCFTQFEIKGHSFLGVPLISRQNVPPALVGCAQLLVSMMSYWILIIDVGSCTADDLRALGGSRLFS
jgi:hypothetical protein